MKVLPEEHGGILMTGLNHQPLVRELYYGVGLYEGQLGPAGSLILVTFSLLWERGFYSTVTFNN